MGINLTNKIPFKTVYLHGLVRDGEGQKMSKTKGNVVDPLDTIDVYGCDALRFTLVVGSTPGQDIPLSAEKVEASRNFVNKLWNIGKFYRRSLGHASAQDIDDKLLDDVSRMPFPEAYFIQQTNHLIREVSSNLQEYQIGEAGKALYQFIWDELADWLVEIVKFRLRSTSTDAICEQRRTLGILRYAWRTSLQLLHPFMPFVTEALWQSDFTGSSLSESIMTSTWPTTSISPDNALQSNDLYQQMVKMIREIRHVRAKYNIASSKGIEAIVFASDAIREQFQKEAGLIGGLANCKTIRFAGEAPPELSPESSVHLIISGDLEVYLPLASLVDAEKERSRIEKQLQKLSKELAGFDARLSNPSFLSGASEAVVSDTKTRASALREQLIALNRALTELNKP